MPKLKKKINKDNDREKLWNIKKNFFVKLESLKKKQDKIIQDYLKFLKQRKIVDVKKKIKAIK
jgi:hypothetical protein